MYIYTQLCICIYMYIVHLCVYVHVYLQDVLLGFVYTLVIFSRVPE
jgi:hypothetical protein